MANRQVGKVSIESDLAFSGTLVCPNCGDTKYGSSDCGDGKLIRTCHGNVNDDTACTFKWPETDDHKYLHIPVEKLIEKGII